MANDIKKINLKDMLHLVHGEMKRIQNLKCPADIEMVKEHTKTLEYLKTETIKIKTAAYTTVVLVTLFGVIVGIIFGVIEYGKKNESKIQQAEKTQIEQNYVKNKDDKFWYDINNQRVNK